MSLTTLPSARKRILSAIAAATRVVGDHDRRLSEVIHRASRISSRISPASASRDSRSARRRTPPLAEGRALERSRRAAAGLPDSSLGRCVQARRQARLLEHPRRTNFLSTFSPAIRSGNLDVLSSPVEHGQEVEELKDEADAARGGASSDRVSPSDVISVPSIADRARRRLVEPGKDVHERRLAGARRAHHGGELPARSSSDTPRSASTDVSPSPYRLATSCAETTGAPFSMPLYLPAD